MPDFTKRPEGFTIYNPDRLHDIASEISERAAGRVLTYFLSNVYPEDDEKDVILEQIEKRMTADGEARDIRLAQRLYKDFVKDAQKGLDRFREKQRKGEEAAARKLLKQQNPREP